MGILETLKPLTDLLPEVQRPKAQSTLKEKLGWTGAGLAIFYMLGQINPLGVGTGIQRFERLEILLGSRTGSLITAGIGPIVLASIFLQLATGAGLLKMDLTKPENKKTFQGLQKLLAILLAVVEAIIYVAPIGGNRYIPINEVTPLLGSIAFTTLAVMFQLALGSILLLYLDEVIQKYGIGSGISLFIAAGVSQAVFLGAFSLAPSGGSTDASGIFWQALARIGAGDVANAIWTLMPMIFTILVFLAVVYIEGMRIELPLAYGRARGVGARYPIKFMYVSNIPVILAAAVLLNVQLVGLFLSNVGFPILGAYTSNQPNPGSIAYFTTALPSPLLIPGGYPAYLQLMMTGQEILHIFVYGLLLVFLCVVFGWFWIESTGMSAKDVAQQLNKSGMNIPGFRQDPRVTERILEKYIPVITILGSIFVGVLAWFADITGALGTGTGILLTVGILYKTYEDLAKQQLFELYPQLEGMVGTG